MKEEYRYKWDKYPKLYTMSQVPLHLDIEVTTRCNLKCIMCEHSFNPPKLVDMTLEIYKKIIDEFIKKGGFAIKLCYLGEPLLHKDLIEFIKYAKNKGVIDIMLATNGNLLNEKLALNLIKSELDFIIFSIDSCHQEIYKKIRINGDLNKVINGLSYLIKLRKKYKSKTPKIQIQAIPMSLNKDEINSKEYYHFWDKYADIIRISPYCENYNKHEIIGETPDFFCENIYQRMTVRADGKIVLCCEKRANNRILGDINENTLEEVWTGKEFNKIRKLMKERKSHLIESCKTCSFRISRSR